MVVGLRKFYNLFPLICFHQICTFFIKGLLRDPYIELIGLLCFLSAFVQSSFFMMRLFAQRFLMNCIESVGVQCSSSGYVFCMPYTLLLYTYMMIEKTSARGLLACTKLHK